MGSVLEAFIALFVVMNPIGDIPLVISLTRGMPKIEARKNIDRAIFVAGVLLFLFLFLGLNIFKFFSIDIDSFQIAGGIILLIIGILYVFGTSLKYVKSHGPDLSIPIGTPLLTGPGVITTTIILVKEEGTMITVVAAVLTLVATWLILANSSKLYKILGEHWTNIISRVMGIFLAAIAVEFIIKGVINSLAPLI